MGTPSEPSGHAQPAKRVSALGEVLRLLHFPGTVALAMVLPVVAIGPLAFSIRDELEFTQSDIGATFAAFFVTSALMSVAGGGLVSRLGAIATVRLGLFGSVCVSAALAAATTRSAIYGAALVGGALNGLTAVAVSLTIMSQVPVYRRGLAFGLRMAGLPSAAAVAGLGAYLAAAGHLSWRHFYWVAAAVALLAGILMRSRRTGHESSAPAQARTGMDGGGRTLFLLGLCGLLGSLGTATVTPFLIDGLIAQGQKAGTAAGVLTLAGWLGIVSRVAVGALSDHVPDPLTHLRASAGFLLVLAASMAFLAVGHGAFLLVGATLMAFSLGLSWPGLFVFATLATHRSRAARAASNVQFGQHSGAVIGPAIFGLIVARHSFAIAWTTTAVVVGLAAILMLNVTRLLSEETRT